MQFEAVLEMLPPFVAEMRSYTLTQADHNAQPMF